MTKDEVIIQLTALSDERTKQIYLKHGAKEPFYGVKFEDLKKLQKKIKKNHDLSLELFDTGISDAMYLAGLIADEHKISKEELDSWAERAYWYMLSEFTVAWVAAESSFGFELAMQWINSSRENIASSSWATLSNLLMIKKDEEIDRQLISNLLDRVQNEIHLAMNRVKYTMNGFVITTGSFYKPLAEKAMDVALKNGKVNVDMGGTSCKVPLAADYIQKAIARSDFKKKKQARC